MRHERKYRITHLHWQEALAAIRLHPASFRTAFPDRTIHNLYLDTEDHRFLQENLTGVGERMKVRIRWYGDRLPITAPQLEHKFRLHGLGSKTVRPLEAPASSDPAHLTQWVRESLQGEAHLSPVLYNSYRRSYLVSWDGRFRLTIDRDLAFGSPQSFARAPLHTSTAVIVEVKYDAAHDTDFTEWAQHLPWPITRNSKYVEGMQLLWA